LAIDNTKIARWLESLHVVRGAKLEREEPGPQFTTLYLRDGNGSVHTVSVNPDGSPREYKDPKGHVHTYNIRYAAPVLPAQPVTAGPRGEPIATPKAGVVQGRPKETKVAGEEKPAVVAPSAQGTARPSAEGAGRAVGTPPVQPPTAPGQVKKGRLGLAPAPTAPKVANPPVTGDRSAHEGEEEKKSLEEVVIEWVGTNQSLTGVSILKREISTKGITFRLKGPDGAEYEVITGMDQQIKAFRKL